MASLSINAKCLATTLALVLSGCVASSRIELAGLRYQEQFRLDRQPLSTEAAPAARLHHHARRDLPAQSLVPLLPPEVLEQLPRSDCLWTAADPVNGRGDVMRLNWEGIVRIRELAPGTDPVEVAMCRLNDPEHGGDIALHSAGLRVGSFVAALNHDGSISVSERAQAPHHLAIAVHTYREGGVLHVSGLPADQIGVTGAYLTLLAPAPGASDPFGVCQIGAETSDGAGLPRPPFNHTLVLAPGVQGLDCPGHPAGVLTLCADGCRWRPQHDAQLLLGGADAYAPITELRPRPEIKVVSQRRSLRRRMLQQGSRHGWSTPRLGGLADPRWRENFMPALRVESVRLLAQLPDGQSVPLPESATELCIRSDAAQPNCRLQCRASAGRAGEFPLLQGCFSPFAQGSVIPTLTPTYEHASLAAAALTQPLHWSVDLGTQALPAGAELLIEFSLGNFGHTAAGLMAEPAAIDIGPLRIGNRRSVRGEFSNVGGAPVQIDRVELLQRLGHPTTDFQLRLLSPPRALPLPIDSIDSGGGLAFWPQADAELIADLRLEAWDGNGSTFFSAHREPRPAPRAVTVYGQNFERIEGQWLHLAGSAEPWVMAEQAHLARYPDSRIDPRRLTGRPLFRTSQAALQPPFLLQPGDRFQVEVSATPSDPGPRQIDVLVTASTLGLSVETVSAKLTVGAWGTIGGDLSVLPGQRHFVAGDDPGWRTRNLLLLNNGDAAAERGPLRIEGDFADRYLLRGGSPPSQRIDPGDSELITVEYLPRSCQQPELAWRLDRPHRAELLIPVVDGVELLVPLVQADPLLCQP